MKARGKFFIGLILISTSAVLLKSCEADADIITREQLKGDDGLQGPEGQQGPQGPEGQPRAQGPQGPGGADGNAIVIVSEWKLATGHKDTIIDATEIKVANVAAPELTESIIEKSAIMVYMTYGEGTFVLPYSFHLINTVCTISFFPKIGKIKPTLFAHDNSNAWSLGNNILYKYVIIPQGTAPKGGSNNNSQPLYRLNNHLYTLDDLKAMSYEEMSLKLNIKE